MELALGMGAVILMGLFVGIVWFKRRADLAFSELATTRRAHADALEQLNALNGRWEAVTQNMGEGIILIAPDARILFFNQAASNLLGQTLQVGQSSNDITWQLQIQPQMQDVLAHRADTLVQTVVHAERTYQVGVRACPVGQACGVMIVVSEMTELQRLGRTRRDFVANISHELRTPVTSLQLLAETLSNELPPDSPFAVDLLTKLRGQIDALRQLTDEMMDLSLIESGQLPIKLIETSAQSLVIPVIDVLSPQAERKHLTLTVQIEDHLNVLADPAGIHKVLSNLIHNAIKFTPEEGTIVVRAHPKGDLVEFSIADSGIGIPARDLPRIFERFYKVDRARTQTGTRGTGLGLAIAKHIIEGHGGSIWVQSVEGQGSIFFFTMPGS